MYRPDARHIYAWTYRNYSLLGVMFAFGGWLCLFFKPFVHVVNFGWNERLNFFFDGTFGTDIFET